MLLFKGHLAAHSYIIVLRFSLIPSLVLEVSHLSYHFILLVQCRWNFIITNALINKTLAGLAVDRENGWICHLSYTHKVAVAWEGRHRVSRSRLMEEYSGKRALTPSERRTRLKPLNDLFSSKLIHPLHCEID